MDWKVCFGLSVACLLAAVIVSIIAGKIKSKRLRLLDPSKVLFVGVALASIILFLPIYTNEFKEGESGIFETFLMSVHTMIRLFIVDGDFEIVSSNIIELESGISKAYSILFSVLFVSAPVLTFGFVLSFFKNVSAYKRYITHYKSDVFVFSELNDQSIALAKSLYDNCHKKRIFVFTDVYEKEEENSFELIEKANELGAICFKKDIAAVNFLIHSKNSCLNFFTIGADQTESISQALKLVEKFKYRDNTNLYVFSTLMETELLLANVFKEPDGEEKEIKIKVRRVNEVQSLIFRNLYEYGFEKIFRSAYEDGSDQLKKISAVVVGMGQHGMEMTKALTWFCQMDGYQIEINSFDISETTESEFCSLCPELMDAKLNGVYDVDGEAKYKISIHGGIDVSTKEFDDKVSSLSRVTYVFVALGNDEKNVSTAVKLRSLFTKLGYSPQIQAVVYNSDKKEALAGITNFKNQDYNIDFIGDTNSSYSEDVILGSDVEKEALARHLKWGNEKEFWQYDYNYKSSVASAIHHKMKILCGIPGADKSPNDRTEDEKWALRKLEHCRWNAYTRSIGYVYGGTTEKEGRNDMAKTHNCLVPFYELPLKEQMKDDD